MVGPDHEARPFSEPSLLRWVAKCLFPSKPQHSRLVASRERRLAVIMFTDMVAYPALSQANEGLALATLESHRALVRPIVAVHNGTEIKTMGDSFLIEFKSALEATESAVDLQKALHEQDQGDGGTIAIRVGLHVGDVVHRDEDVYGRGQHSLESVSPR